MIPGRSLGHRSLGPRWPRCPRGLGARGTWTCQGGSAVQALGTGSAQSQDGTCVVSEQTLSGDAGEGRRPGREARLPWDRLRPALVLRGFCSHCCFRCHGDHRGNTLHPVQVHPAAWAASSKQPWPALTP